MKVKLPREVAEAVERLRLPTHGFRNFSIIGMMFNPRDNTPDILTINKHMGQDGMHPDDFISALVNGYEIEHIPTPREKAQKLLQYYYGYHPNDESMAEIEAIYNYKEVSE